MSSEEGEPRKTDMEVADEIIQEISGWYDTERVPRISNDIRRMREGLIGTRGIEVAQAYMDYLIHHKRFHIDAERDICSPLCGFSSVFSTYFEKAVIDQEGEDAIADIEYCGGVTLDTLRGFIKSSSDAMLQKRFLLLYLLCFLYRGTKEEYLDLETSSGEFVLFETTKSRILSEAFFLSKPDTVDEQIIAAFKRAASSMLREGSNRSHRDN